MSDLLPCPFCGGTDTIILNGPVEDDWCAVSCEKCHARGPIDYTDPHAIAAWNRRALPAVTPAPTLAEALELPEVKALVEAARDGHQTLIDAAEEIAELRLTMSKADLELPWLGDAIDKISLALRRIAEGGA